MGEVIADEMIARFICMDCGVNTLYNKEYYMIDFDLWDSITTETKGNGMLCVSCVEKRLGRPLTRKDFTDAPLNEFQYFKDFPDRHLMG